MADGGGDRTLPSDMEPGYNKTSRVGQSHSEEAVHDDLEDDEQLTARVEQVYR